MGVYKLTSRPFHRTNARVMKVNNDPRPDTYMVFYFIVVVDKAFVFWGADTIYDCYTIFWGWHQ